MIKRLCKNTLRSIGLRLPLVKDILQSANTITPIRFSTWFIQKWIGINKLAYWPMHFTSKASGVHRIRIGIGTSPGLSQGCYIQGANGVEIGDYTYIGPNVGIISANHSIYNVVEHVPSEPVKIGNYCWIGMNSVILPGVYLGDHTVVAAGSVVSKSAPEGYCVLAGIPAKPIKRIDRALIVEHKDEPGYIGYYSLAGKTKEDIYRSLGIQPVGTPIVPQHVIARNPLTSSSERA